MPRPQSLTKDIIYFLLILSVSYTSFAMTPPKEATPANFAQSLPGGWSLTEIQEQEALLPFVKVPCLKGIYRKVTPQKETLELHLTIAAVAEPAMITDALKFHDNPGIPAREIKDLPRGVSRLIWREGYQDSPAASANAAKIQALQITIHKPPLIAYVDGHGVTLPEEAIQAIIDHLN